MKKLMLCILSIFLLTCCTTKTDSTNPNTGKSSISLHEFNKLDYNTLKAGSYDTDFFVYDFGFKNNFIQLVYYAKITINGEMMGTGNGFSHGDTNNAPWDHNGVPEKMYKDMKLIISILKDANYRNPRNEDETKKPLILSFISIKPDGYSHNTRISIPEDAIPNLDKNTLTLDENNLINEISEYTPNKQFDLGYITYTDNNENVIMIEFKAMVVTDFDERV